MKTTLLRPHALAIVIAIAVLAGCATPAVTPTATLELSVPTATPLPESVKITFWEWFGGAMGDFFEKEADLFHGQYPWIVVEVSHFPDQSAYRETLGLAFESGNAPDTFIKRHPFRQMVENGWIQPLDSWITPDWLAKFPEGSFVETTNMWEEKIYAFPTYAFKYDSMLYINEDLFREAGLVDADGNVLVPQTWSDLRSMAKEITEAGNNEFYGIGIGIKDSRHMSWWFDLAGLAGAGGSQEIDYRTGRYTYGTDPAYAQVVELLLSMKADGSVYPYEGTLDDSNLFSFFGQGKFAIFLSGSWSANNLKRDFPDFQNYRIIPLPVPDAGRKGGLMTTPGAGSYFMSSQTAHPDEAWLWLDWISSRGFHERMVTNGLDFSVYADLNTPENIADPHKVQAFEAATQYVVYGPFPPARNPQTTLVRPEPVVPDVGDVLIGIYTGQIEDWLQALIDLDTRKQTALEAAIQQARDAGAEVSLEDYTFPDWNPMESYVTRPKE
jgi:ABC-type glycerol-3-phosphate transport system substrate-binding protein